MEFNAEDPESNDVTYQIEIDDNYDFGSMVVNHDSQTNDTEFQNIITPSDKDPFNSQQMVRFTPPSALATSTYYWRVRAKDRTASTVWSDWSAIRSFTINSSTTITTWFQTMMDQFSTDDHDQTEATSTP